MTYRNDHDAALARIDALESELARARADDGATAARTELDRLEGEIKRRRAERDRLELEIDNATPDRKRFRGAKLALAMMAIAALVGLRALFTGERGVRTSEPPAYVPPPPTPPPTVPRSATRLVECAGELARAVAEHTTSSQACIEQIRIALTDTTLGDDVHSLLARWLAAEEAIGHADIALEHRDALAPEVRRVIIPSFTR
jgi:hypothetical protein